MTEPPPPSAAGSTGTAGTLPAVSSDRRDVLPPGTPAGRYRIVGQLGAGGMGVVYAAHDPKLDRRVALKALHRERGGAHDPVQPSRLVEEAQSMARLAHPNVVTVHDVFIDNDQAFVAMELVDGESLRHWLNAAVRG
jgi:serine/threonine protein kinase